MRIRVRRALAVASAVALLCAATAITWPVAAYADSTSTVGWVRLAQLSPALAPVDVYLSAVGNSGAQSIKPVLTHATYGAVSQYQPVVPGDYTVQMNASGTSSTTDPLAGTQITVAAGQSYTVAALGVGSITKVSVLDDAIDTSPGEANVRVIDASPMYPAASVSIGSDNVAANLHAPSVAPYKSVDPAAGAVLVATGAVAQNIPANLAANSAYSVLVLDGSQSTARVLVLTDAAGISSVPKGGVNTGFGGAAGSGGDIGETHTQSYTAPIVELLSVFLMLGFTATAQVRRRRRKRALEISDGE